MSQALKPERETLSASESHATGQIERCFVMNANLISRPWQSRLQPFYDVALRLQLGDFTTEPIDLKLLWLHLTFSMKGLAGIVAVLATPFVQNILVDIKVTGRLGNSDPTLLDQLHPQACTCG